MANRVNASAVQINSTQFPVSARNAYFRAATYYRSADFYLHGNKSDPRIDSLWVQQAAAFDEGLKLLPIPGRRITIQAEGFTIPTIYYPSSQEPTPRRPTIIIGGGYDGGMEELYHQSAVAALERGYNVITYEGPGQATVVREQNLGFILEWEKVVTPIVDYLLNLPEVDASAIALVGLSFGGLLAPRAAAFEHRLAAVIALDGLYTFGSLFLSEFPPTLVSLFNSSNQTGFDAATNAALISPNRSTEFKWTVEQGMWAFATDSPFDWMTQIQAFTLEGVIDQIKGPVFVADAQGDLFFQGQGKVLADKLGNRSTYYEFLTADGSGQHAGIGSFVKQAQVTMDWFQEVLDAK
jgi:dienelactone hydrolase